MLSFNSCDWVFANGHQTAPWEQFQGRCAVMQTECQIDLLTASAIMCSCCHWHILQGEKMFWVTLSVCHTLLCPVCRHLKTAKALWKVTFPRGVKKKNQLPSISAFHTRKTEQRGLAIVKVWGWPLFSPWQVSFESVPFSYVSLQRLWRMPRKQHGTHDRLISDVFWLILSISTALLSCVKFVL